MSINFTHVSHGNSAVSVKPTMNIRTNADILHIIRLVSRLSSEHCMCTEKKTKEDNSFVSFYEKAYFAYLEIIVRETF